MTEGKQLSGRGPSLGLATRGRGPSRRRL